MRLADVRAVFRLVGECRELGSDWHAWRAHMLDGLRRLTGAQVALYLHISHLGSSREQIAEALDSGFLDDAGRALWAHYQGEQAHRTDPFHQRFFRGFNGSVRTRELASVVEPFEWRRSPHYNDYVRACRLDDRLTSSAHVPGTSPAVTQVIVLHRAAADGEYPQRARRLVELFHEELLPLIGRQLALPESGKGSLPIRLEQVLRCLLGGDSEKQVAARLDLSPHTVNRHVRRLYERFGVHSRGELMFHCRNLLPTRTAADGSAKGEA